MKREIVCTKCEKDLKELFPKTEPYPGEYVRFISGMAKKEMYCDSCGAIVNINDKCCAFSIYSNNRPYIGWEGDYIKEARK